METRLFSLPISFLILHKVRGEPAFDIAEQIPCPECVTHEYVEHMAVAESNRGCDECNHAGFWWIIPTSGHRAYPWFSQPLNEIIQEDLHNPILPAGWPDHYPCNPSPKPPTFDLLGRLGLRQKVERRI